MSFLQGEACVDPAGRTTSSSKEVLHLRLMCCSAGSWKRGSPGASHLRLDVSVMGSMKGAFLYPSRWVPIASAVPQLLHQITLRFPWCSPKLTARGRGFVVTCIFKNNPFCSSRGKGTLGSSLPAPLQLKRALLQQPLGISDGKRCL